MKILTKTLIIKTKKEFEIIRITDKVMEFVKKSKIKQGLINIFSRHTTLAVKINESEKMLLKDYENFLKKIVSDDVEYNHDKLELRKNCPENEPKNAAGHLRCLLLSTSETVPVINYNLHLGKYQEIFAIETSGPRKRAIILQVLGE